MPLFSYVILDDKAAEQRGHIDATDKNDAIRQLRSKKWFVIDLKLHDSSKQQSTSKQAKLAVLDIRRYLPIRLVDRINFFRQLSLMLRSGHTVLQALDSLRHLVERPRLGKVCLKITEDIRAGKSFSRAVADSDSFAPLISKLLEAGEASGDLDVICLQVADNLERQADLKRQLITSLSLPMFTVVVSIGVVVFLVVGVLPKFAQFLKAKGSELPPATQRLMDISSFMEDWGAYLGIGSGLFIFSIFAFYTSPAGKLLIDRVLLRVPLIGTALIGGGMAQFGWTLSMLLRSGLTAMDSLKVCASIQGNACYALSIEKMAAGILKGESLSTSISSSVMPKMVRHLVAVGESSGELDTVMEEIGEFYKKDLEARIKRMTALIEPLMTVIIGGLVGYIYFAFFQAVMAVSTGGK
ncbi:MAG: type II secretion system F family protein [Cycloclasticus sp.]